MKLHTRAATAVLSLSLVPVIALFDITAVQAVGTGKISAEKARVVEHWTPQQRAAAIPRVLVIDQRGLGYLRRPDGSLQPYGHQIAAEAYKGTIAPMARPGGADSDTTSPTISNLDPALGDTIGTSHTFRANVTDDNGIRSVTFVIRYPDGTRTSSFSAIKESGSDEWSLTIQGFSESTQWAWWVEAKDTAKKGGNTSTSPSVDFSVDSSGSSGGAGSTGPDTVTNTVWSEGGAIQTAAGRIYFEMPANSKWKGPWQGYVCSGTVVNDETTGRSTILTAAHCTYDDVNKAFARNVLFIPDQANTSGSDTDQNCSNDPLGCWVPDYGVVDTEWTTRTFPDNIAWDYAFYVVDDSSAHSPSPGNTVLDSTAGALSIDFFTAYVNDGVDGAGSIDFTHGLGYSYNNDPDFMYCAEDMTTKGQANWWLPSCELSGGASGGPWVQPMNLSAGSGPVISVNSWSYTTSPGMAGPKLLQAECLFTTAKTTPWASVSNTAGKAGVSVNCL